MKSIIFPCRLTFASCIPHLWEYGSDIGLTLGFELGFSVGMVPGAPVGYPF